MSSFWGTPITPEMTIAIGEKFGFPFGPQEETSWYECSRCEMGVVGTRRSGPKWQEHHECPEPFPYETARYLLQIHSGPSGVPCSLKTRARIKLGLERDRSSP